MNTVIFHKLPIAMMSEMYRALGDQGKVAKELLDKGFYVSRKLPDMEGSIEEIADELFDLTNNPSRDVERDRVWGWGSSLSVGDIVQVGNKRVVCCSFGWKGV